MRSPPAPPVSYTHLILGSAETVGNLSHRFEPVDNKLRIFRRLNQPLPQSEVEFPAGKARGTHQPAETPLSVHVENIGQLTDQLIQQNYAPAAVLVLSLIHI